MLTTPAEPKLVSMVPLVFRRTTMPGLPASPPTMILPSGCKATQVANTELVWLNVLEKIPLLPKPRSNWPACANPRTGARARTAMPRARPERAIVRGSTDLLKEGLLTSHLQLDLPAFGVAAGPGTFLSWRSIRVVSRVRMFCHRVGDNCGGFRSVPEEKRVVGFGFYDQGTPYEGRPLSVQTAIAKRLLKWRRRKHARSFSTNGIKGRWIDSQSLKNGRRHLCGAHFGVNRLGLEVRFGEQQHDIRVVMCKTAVLGQFRVAAGVSNAHVRGHDDVWRARVYGWVVEVKRQRRAVVDLP